MAVIRGRECHCGYPTGHFPLRHGADRRLCSAMPNASSAAAGGYCLAYQTPVQGTAPAAHRNACFTAALPTVHSRRAARKNPLSKSPSRSHAHKYAFFQILLPNILLLSFTAPPLRKMMVFQRERRQSPGGQT